MAGKAIQEPVAHRGVAPWLGVVGLAVAVFLGGATMTAGWTALFFVGAEEPDPKPAPRDPVRVRAPGKRLLWLVFDSMRADAAFDAELMPNLAALRRQGVWGVARTGSFTMTGTCVRALGTGVEPRPTHAIHNFRSPPVRGDSLFRRLHRAGRRIVLIGDHIWIDLYRNTVRQSYPQPDLGIDDLHRTDRAALKDARRLLPGGWDLVVLHLIGSDHAAHKDRGVRGLYRQKLAEYDSLIPELRRRMGPDASVLVMADHSCNAVGNHGAGEPEATRAPFVLAGPGVLPLGRRDTDQRSLAPTVTALLGVASPWGAELPALYEALELSDAERAALAYNHAAGRRAHLQAILGRGVPELDRLLAEAKQAREAGRYPAARKASVRLLRRATELRQAALRASGWLWIAVLSLFLTVPLLLLAAGAELERTGGSLRLGLLTLLPSAAAVSTLFVLDSRVSTLIGAGLLLGLALLWFAAHRRWSLLPWCGLAAAPFALVLLGGWSVDWLLRLHRGDPTGRLWLSAPALGLVLGSLGWLRATGRLSHGLREYPGLAAALWAVALFLPLPAVRWWGGRHALVGGVGVVLVLGLAGWAWRRRFLTLRFGVGAGLLLLLLALGLACGFGSSPKGSSVPLAWLVALGVPAAILALPKARPDEARLDRGWWIAGGVILLAWILAHLPRLGWTGLTWYALWAQGLAVLALVLLRQGSGAHLAVLVLGLFRLLAGDHAVAATALFGGGVLGLAQGGVRVRGPAAVVAVALVMAVLELVLFFQLGREFSFGTIDVTVGFVGGGGLNLVRVTVLIVLAYAAPWWLLWSAAVDLVAGEQGLLIRLLVVQLWILGIKVLGTFLLFLGRPAHFWLIHSLIPFQFYALAQLIMVTVGFSVAYIFVRNSCQARCSSSESRAML
ncbi:MAG: alkaline phosphatase family protein [bacterium]